MGNGETKFSYRALNSATLFARRFFQKPRIDRWVAVSNSVSRSHKSVGNIDCTVIPNFTEISSDPCPRLEERRGVLYVGRLSQEKGIAHILDKASRLPCMEFTVAGDGPMKHVVAEAAGDLANLNYVGFVSQEEARRLIRGAVACLMPSIWQEPGPLSCIEAMAEGTPVVCYPNGGLAEFVEAARAGIVCRDSAPEELTRALRSLFSGEIHWHELSANGQAAVRARHSLPEYLDSLEFVYRSAINSA